MQRFPITTRTKNSNNSQTKELTANKLKGAPSQ